MNMRVCRLKNHIVLSFIHSFDWLGGGGRLGLGARGFSVFLRTT